MEVMVGRRPLRLVVPPYGFPDSLLLVAFAPVTALGATGCPADAVAAEPTSPAVGMRTILGLAFVPVPGSSRAGPTRSLRRGSPGPPQRRWVLPSCPQNSDASPRFDCRNCTPPGKVARRRRPAAVAGRGTGRGAGTGTPSAPIHPLKGVTARRHRRCGRLRDTSRPGKSRALSPAIRGCPGGADTPWNIPKGAHGRRGTARWRRGHGRRPRAKGAPLPPDHDVAGMGVTAAGTVDCSDIGAGSKLGAY